MNTNPEINSDDIQDIINQAGEKLEGCPEEIADALKSITPESILNGPKLTPEEIDAARIILNNIPKSEMGEEFDADEIPDEGIEMIVNIMSQNIQKASGYDTAGWADFAKMAEEKYPEKKSFFSTLLKKISGNSDK